MSDYETLLTRAKAYARDNDLQATWNEVRSEFRDLYDRLLDHEKRKVRVEFEGWITRERREQAA